MTIRPGNLGRRALRGPGSWGLNFALGKNFAITEQMKLQVRGDLFNALNNLNLGGPDGNIESRNFGRILGAGAARVIPLNARPNF